MSTSGPGVLSTLVVEGGAHVVRRAHPDDLPALVALLAADPIAAARGESAGDLEPYRRALVDVDADPHQLVVCLDDPAGTIVGTLQLTVIPGLSRRGVPRAQIEAVRVAGPAQGRGLGTAFLGWAVQWAREAGCGLVQLTTDATRHDAHRFYRRLGFAHTHHGLKLDLGAPAGEHPAPEAVACLAAAYEPLLALADRIDEPTGWTPSTLPGWTVRDLLFHLTEDARRALVALATPAGGAADTDAVSYWAGWRPGSEAADAGRRAVRVIASQPTSVRGVADEFARTARAVLVAARRADPTEVVETQGHRLTVDALLRTLVVEAAVHHLDVGPAVPAPPAPAAVTEVRDVLEGLLGTPTPIDDDVRWILVGTGRAEPTAEERAALGALVDRLPLFG